MDEGNGRRMRNTNTTEEDIGQWRKRKWKEEEGRKKRKPRGEGKDRREETSGFVRREKNEKVDEGGEESGRKWKGIRGNQVEK